MTLFIDTIWKKNVATPTPIYPKYNIWGFVNTLNKEFITDKVILLCPHKFVPWSLCILSLKTRPSNTGSWCHLVSKENYVNTQNIMVLFSHQFYYTMICPFFFLSMNLFPIPGSRIPLMVRKESISKVKQSHWIAEEIKVTFSFLFMSAENMMF